MKNMVKMRIIRIIRISYTVTSKSFVSMMSNSMNSRKVISIQFFLP